MKTFNLPAVFMMYSLLLLLTVNVYAQTVPSDLMRNCDQWKITYPDGEEDKTLCSEANNEFWFVNDAGDGMVFFAPVRSDNGTTPNSSYIRSELRERTEDGGSDIYWTTEGRHVLYVEQAITHLPTVKNHLVATQIHGDKEAGIDDALVLRLEGSHLFLSFNGEKLRSDVTIKTDYVLGTKHEIMFEVLDDKHYVYYSEDGNLWNAYTSGDASQYLVKDGSDPVLMDLYYDQSYFKVGNYTQSNPEKEGDETDEPDNYGEVVVYDFIVEHGGDGYSNNGDNGGGDPVTDLAPYDLTKFQDYLEMCKLQAPTSTTEATPADIIDGYKSETFYVADEDKMAFTMSGTSQRSELRNETNWYVGDENQTLHTNLIVAEQTCEQLTFIQIHDDANVGSGPNKPLLRVYRHTTKNSVDHIWAVVKTDDTGINNLHYDLGATPSGYFDCDVTIEGNDLVIEVNGSELVRHDISYWTFPNYWKNGVYLQDEGTATTHFNELTLTTWTPSGGTAVSDVTLSPSNVSLEVNETLQLTATVSPSDADNKSVSYNSSNSSVATVDVNGLITAKAEGSATISVETADGGYTASTIITVSETVSSGLIPADLMRNCDQWKITYPTGDEVKQLCPEENNEFFYVNDTEDGIVFRAPVRSDNGTTPNSSYIRSELRERTEDGSADIYWTTEGKHVLYVEQAITHLPTVKNHLVATQIHGDKAAGIDDALVLRLEGSHLFLSFNGEKLRSDVTIKTDYVLGTKHEVMFEVIDDKHYVYYSEDGNLWTAYEAGNASQYLVTDNGDPVLMDLYYDQSYFKVGNYTQSNPEQEGGETDEADNYGEVVVFDFIVEHGESDGPVDPEEPNIALNKTVVASGTPEVDNPASALVDGSTSTRVSVQGYPQSFIIDLEDNYDISSTALVFHNDRAYQYTIGVASSMNGPFDIIVDQTANTTAGTVASPLVDDILAVGRYIEVTITGADADSYTGDWISVLEFRAYGEVALITNASELVSEKLSVYPVPAKDVLNYAYKSAEAISLHSVTGELVLSIEVAADAGSIDVSSLPAGIYLLKVEGESSAYQQVIIE